jgi:CubicO group peptidase (beta-lactamase class C family)
MCRSRLVTRNWQSVIVTLALVTAATSAFAQSLPTAKPEEVGLSSQRLARMNETMERYVKEGRIAGVVTLIVRRGQVAHFGAFGKADIEANVPMATDSIFRIASQTKAITSTAIMMLMEEGKLVLSDPVSKFIPAFKNTTVAVEYRDGSAPSKPIMLTMSAKRAITIRDLLTHTSGISYGEEPLTASTYQAAGIQRWYFADRNEPIAAVIDRLAKLPFDAQPGEKYLYGYSTDILGVVVEKASGMSLDEFFRTRIFTPLKMVDTYFFLPQEKKARLTAVYSAAADGSITRAPNPGQGQGDYVDGPRMCFSGGAGLVSTAMDYARFLQMYLNGGELDGVRLLSPKTVELITSNHIGSLKDEGRFGFGLGFEITEHVGRSGRPGSVGEFGWGGAYHTYYWADPQEQLVAVFMTQLRPDGMINIQPTFRALVYQAIVAPPGAAKPYAKPR